MLPIPRNPEKDLVSFKQERHQLVKITQNKMTAAALAAVVLLLGMSALAQDAARALEDADEATLIAVIQKTDAPFTDKLKACRGLRIRGTVAAIPALAAMLPDPELSHIARYALEPMPYPEAGQALRDAVAKSAGRQKSGLAASIGYRRDAEGVTVLVPLLADADIEIAQAAAAALGRIATPEAVDALFKCTGPDTVKPAIAEGLLAAGQWLAANGAPQASDIFQKLLAPEWPEFVRTGAFYGLADAQPDAAPQRLIEALRGEDALFRNIAAAIIGETAGAEHTKLYADTLASLPADGQVALVRGLMARKDPVARPAVVAAAQGADSAVKTAAVKALSVLGTPEDAPMLAALLDNTDPALADAANYALTMTRAEGANAAIAATVPESSAAIRARLLELLANRRAEQALGLSMTSLVDADAGVRVAALKALPPLAGEDQVPALIDALKKAASGTERTAADRVLVAVAGRSGEKLLPVVLEAMKTADAESTVALLHVVARIGGGQALETVLAALDNKEAAVSDEAVRVLSDWPTLDAVPHVLELARSETLSRHVLGLRGYVRLAGVEGSGETKIKMLQEAMQLAKRPEEKKVVLGAWGAVFATQSLDALRPALDDPEVQSEAAAAIISVTSELAKNPAAKQAALDALNDVVKKAQDAAMKDRAQNALAKIQ